ncbi:hypothetical protein ACFFMN_08115 [Planobispora siamensis]|uniref:Uncharacterized protein n=1 Tax=Planobispora siamensis TaxID=936338 RepID=A0A8J3WIG3_9ACTN|nr:hypothetical protein [Planobispora siamensis]GIH90455.1 hypothetical protein Psi01_10850 [Planobispora siamensis]
MLGIVGVPLLALIGLMVMQWLESAVLSSPAESPSRPAPPPRRPEPLESESLESEPLEQAGQAVPARPARPSSPAHEVAPGRRTATACRVRTRHGAVLPARPHRIGGRAR